MTKERNKGWRAGVAGILFGMSLLLAGSPVGAQATDDPEAGGVSDEGALDPGSGLGAPDPSDSGSGSADGGLALTGGDVTGLVAIGAAALGTGAVLVLSSRRRSEATVTV